MAGSVTLQFSAQDDLGSLAIRYFEHGQWSHVDLVLPDGSLLGARSDKILGIPPGVQVRPSTYANFTSKQIVALPCADHQAEAAYEFAHEQIGKPYDATAILAFAIGRDWRSDDSWFCSELAAAAIEMCGIIPYKLAVTENKVTPGDLFLICSVLVNVG